MASEQALSLTMAPATVQVMPGMILSAADIATDMIVRLWRRRLPCGRRGKGGRKRMNKARLNNSKVGQPLRHSQHGQDAEAKT